MTLIELRFTPENAELILTGRKLATLRRTAHGHQGDRFRVGERVFELTGDPAPIALGDAARLYHTDLGQPVPWAVLKSIARSYGLQELPDVTGTWWIHCFRPADLTGGTDA